jgi:hypothetical protein
MLNRIVTCHVFVDGNMNGQAKAQDNYAAFKAWASRQTDADFREISVQGLLCRQEICRECCFNRSVLLQNPRIKADLHDLEGRLRDAGVLPKIAAPVENGVPLRAQGQLQARTDAERLKALEAENLSLRAVIADLQKRLKRFEAMDALLGETGRFAR